MYSVFTEDLGLQIENTRKKGICLFFFNVGIYKVHFNTVVPCLLLGDSSVHTLP